MARLFLAILIGKLILFLTRFLKSGGGSAAPGLYALKIDPNLIFKLASQIPQNIVITGTNGKTTTARILNHLVTKQNQKTIRNSTGSNLERGIASTLISASHLRGGIVKIRDCDLGIWELDEAAFNSVVFKLKPRMIVFLNAFRDQLDRYGEVDSVVNKWQSSLEKINWNPRLIINGSDTNTSKLARIKNFTKTIFSVRNHSGFGETYHGEKIPELRVDIEARNIKLNKLEGSTFQLTMNHEQLAINLPIPGVYHIYDFLASFSAYYQLNLPTDTINESLTDFSPAFGRVEKIDLNGKEAYIFLIKNPAGASLVFETIAPQLKKEDRLLMALNDNFADGKDVSWIWDAEFEQFFYNPSLRGVKRRGNLVDEIASPMVRNDAYLVCTGTRAYDLGLRLKYAGLSQDQIVVEKSLDEALAKAQKGLNGRLFILPTYTALLELQKILTQKGVKAHYWKE